jgi:2-polyprenyl-3-methyl-5-hydroxy-6-metoxy-1,4-benzoquinol methylase
MSFYSTCKICSSPKVKNLYTSRRTGLTVARCEACRLVFVRQRFSEALLADFYSDESYLAFAEGVRNPKVHTRHLQWVSDIERYCKVGSATRRLRLLDVGCGVGDFLKVARDKGFEIEGLEISRLATQLAREWNGVEVTLLPLEQCSRDQFFDAVTLIGLVEHVLDPRSLLQHGHRVLSKGGVLFVYTPVWGRYDTIGLSLARASRGRLPQLIDRRINKAHLQIFPETTLINLLQELGFDVLRCDVVCEYNLPTESYLESVGITNHHLKALAARALDALIDRGVFFKNNMRIFARKI